MPARCQTPRRAALVFAAAQLLAGVAFACKNRDYPSRFPVEELAAYEHVYVVRVDQVVFSRPPEVSWAAPPFTFGGEIVRSLKGSLHVGDAIRATTSTEEPAARCPIHLEAGKTYLLMLNGLTSPYQLPRYGSLFVASGNEHFDYYVRAIAHAGKQTGGR